jgi:ankyrin repeat protein
VYCQIIYLRRCLPGRIRHALDELPETLDGTYNRALREIDKASWEFAYRLLQCVAVAFRPLRVAELAEVLSFDFKARATPEFREDWRLGDPVEAVLSTTSSLLAIVDVEGSRVIQSSHYSVKEFLTSSRLAESNDIICRRYHISMTPANTLAAQACLGILLHLDETVVGGDSLEKYPLAEYAAEHWVDHARIEGVSGNIEDGMIKLFDPSELHLAIWLWIYDPVFPRRYQSREADLPSLPRRFPWHYAADCGLHAIVKFLIIQPSQDVDSRAFDDKLTPLHLASERGYEDVVHLLLEHGANTTVQNLYGQTPLHLASRSKQEKVARSLLDRGADVTAQENGGWTPLHWASVYGHEDIGRLLLEHGADATSQDNNGMAPLHQASRHRHEDFARLLLEHGADATSQEKGGWTPLHLASQNRLEDIARLLLEHGANATAQDKKGWTSLHRASLSGHENIARLLLEHGADATAQDERRQTPLHLASQYGHEDISRLLLEHGADATAQDARGETPLHWVSVNGREDIARLLLEHGADATAHDIDGMTPLHQASRHGHEDISRLLLEHDTDAYYTAPSSPLGS